MQPANAPHRTTDQRATDQQATDQRDRLLSPTFHVSLGTSLGNAQGTSHILMVSYEGRALQAANHALARLCEKVAARYDEIAKMPATHEVSTLQARLADTFAPFGLAAGLLLLNAGRNITGGITLVVSLALRFADRLPLPCDEYLETSKKLKELQQNFQTAFQDPFKMRLPEDGDRLSPATLRYALAGILALIPGFNPDDTRNRECIRKLAQATELLDLKIDPLEEPAPDIIRSEDLGSHVKTLALLGRLFGEADYCSLNCFESFRARFETCFNELKAHLSTVELRQLSKE